MICPICGTKMRYLREITSRIIEVWWCPEFCCQEEVWVYPERRKRGQSLLPELSPDDEVPPNG